MPTSPPATPKPAPALSTASAAAVGARTAAIMVRLSLAANIAILLAVCTVLIAFSDAEPVVHVWGPRTDGRGILLSVYFAILLASAMLLALHTVSADKAAAEHMVVALLAVQILYKISTPITAGPANPVAISNLAISALHAATLYFLWRRHTARCRAAPPNAA